VTSTVVSQRAAVVALLVEIPTAVVANSLNLSVGEGGLQADLDTVAQAEPKKPGPKGGQNPVGGGSGHVGGAPGVGDPVHCGMGVWLL
jgi:hypothetical protein